MTKTSYAMESKTIFDDKYEFPDNKAETPDCIRGDVPKWNTDGSKMNIISLIQGYGF